jgi:hypothetical protein
MKRSLPGPEKSDVLADAQARTEWLYCQIFLQNGLTAASVPPTTLRALCDRLILGYVRRWIDDLLEEYRLDQFFFIRYAEGGYHLRLRLKGEAACLDGPVRAYLEEEITHFFARHGLPDGSEGLPLSSGRLRDDGWLRYARYEPEYTKYGGDEGMRLAEAHFQVSSRLSFQVLQAEADSRIDRAQFALELMDILLSLFGATAHEKAFLLKGYTGYWLALAPPDQQAAMVASMEENYRQKKDKLAGRFAPGRPGALEASWRQRVATPTLFDEWRQHLGAHLQQIKMLEMTGRLNSPISSHVNQHQSLLQQAPTINATPTVALLILPNYLHMLNNRLGLTPLQEVQLTHLLYRSLEEELGIEADFYSLILEPGL